MLPLASLPDGKLRLFICAINSSSTFTFAIKKEPGEVIQVVAAACRRCYEFGSRQQADEIICGHCNGPMRFGEPGRSPADQEDCTLLPLPAERQSDQVVVRREALRRAFDRWFRFVAGRHGAPRQVSE